MISGDLVFGIGLAIAMIIIVLLCVGALFIGNKKFGFILLALILFWLICGKYIVK
jgi:hypothetical protein